MPLAGTGSLRCHVGDGRRRGHAMDVPWAGLPDGWVCEEDAAGEASGEEGESAEEPAAEEPAGGASR